MKLHNTMTRQKEALKADHKVTVYTCGPTVYLDSHIGNWRSFIFYDTLIRSLKLQGFDVYHVLNITDVGHLVSDGDTGEDKLTKTAKSQRKTAWEVAEHYTQLFLQGMKELNITTPTKLPKATDHINQQIEMITAIEAAGYTYEIDDGIYFDTAKLTDYGKLMGKTVHADEEFARINRNDQKRSPEDFALWKFSPKDEQRDMEWDSPWGVGFPGWHLECSAMAKTYLGDTIDIHAGGVDHIPVHHTNEIAQSETANGVEFAKIWLHGEFMKVDGAKMSKSLGNFYTLEDVKDRGYEPLAFRMLIIQGNYRTETNFTWDNLQAAANRLLNLRKAAEKRWQLLTDDDNAQSFEELRGKLVDALADDLNTPVALEQLSAGADLAAHGCSGQNVAAYIELLQAADRGLGLGLLDSTPKLDETTQQLLAERTQARQDKDFAHSDDLRDKLAESGITVLDGPSGQIWSRY